MHNKLRHMQVLNLFKKAAFQADALKRSCYLFCKLVLVLFSVALLQSCASYGTHATSMRDGLLQGKPNLSLAIAEEKDVDQQEVISSLDKGMLRRINDDFSGSNQIFEVAKQEIEHLYGISITENLGALAINETMRGYKGYSYEQLLLHAYMAMNFIQLGQLDGARIEMLQANVKMMEWGDGPEEDAFLRYLEGIIYESLGEMDSALISYRKSYIAYKEKGGLEYPTGSHSIKRDLLRLLALQGLSSEYKSRKKAFNMMYEPSAKASKDMGELVVILNNGLAPIKSEMTIPIYSTEAEQNLHVAFPVYRQPKQILSTPHIHVNTKEYSMETVKDIDAQARYSLEQAMPGIMLRATARAVVKYNTQHAANKSSEIAGLLMAVTNMITERADTRSWTTLPQEIQLKRILLPVGEHNVQIKMHNATDQIVDVMEEKVTIESGQIHFLIKHWVAKKPLNEK